MALAEAAAGFYSGVARFAYLHQEELIAIVAGLTLIGAAGYVLRKKRRALKKLWRLRRGKQMTRKERKLYLRSLVGSQISDLLVDLELDGKISTAESNTLLRRLSQVLDMKDMMKPPLQEPTTADAIRLARMIHLHKKVKIPGPKPGEQVTPVTTPQDDSNVVELPVTTNTGRKFGNFVRKHG